MRRIQPAAAALGYLFKQVTVLVVDEHGRANARHEDLHLLLEHERVMNRPYSMKHSRPRRNNLFGGACHRPGGRLSQLSRCAGGAGQLLSFPLLQ